MNSPEVLLGDGIEDAFVLHFLKPVLPQSLFELPATPRKHQVRT